MEKTPRLGPRLLGVYILVATWIVVLLLRLVQLQVWQGKEYRLQGRQQQSAFTDLQSKRGEILDRHLEELAISVQTESVFAHPERVGNALLVAGQLAPVLKQDTDEIYKKLISERPFVYLARKISPHQAARVRALQCQGVALHKENKRFYPASKLAAHVLGFVGTDNLGLSGLEYQYDDRIKGETKRIFLQVDAKRSSYARDAFEDDTSGNRLVLSIDRSIQFIVEQVLERTVTEHRATGGSAIVMNPHNGEILAMASFPSFNPNQFGNASDQERRNRCILDSYEPGSTFKVVTLAAVLNENLATPAELVDCRVGTLRLAGKVYREAKRSFGSLSVNEILAKSSNVGTIKLGLRLGESRLHDYMRRFGFGTKTGIDLPGEQVGLVRPVSQWSKISIGALSIGQELAVTPLQLLRAFSAIANGGYLVTPRVTRQVVSPEGELLFSVPLQRRRILKLLAVDRMKAALAMVVESGTGHRARLAGYSSGGKTGTAQKFIDGHYSKTLFVASYVGFAPLQEPALAAIVIVDEPRGDSYYGGTVAAPAFKQIAERALIHLRVSQDELADSEEEFLMEAKSAQRHLAQRARSVDYSLGERELQSRNLEETVLSLMEKGPRLGDSTSEVTVHSGYFQLPDFTGLSMREVAREGARRGLQMQVLGAGLAVGQRPPAGTPVLQDMVCEVFFSTWGPAGNESRHATE